jgi:hypothetical protein
MDFITFLDNAPDDLPITKAILDRVHEHTDKGLQGGAAGLQAGVTGVLSGIMALERELNDIKRRLG